YISSRGIADCFDQPLASSLPLSSSASVLPVTALGWGWEFNKRELAPALCGEEARSDYEVRLRP
ncbi:MAG: hypothetical protein IRZ24_04395, partial [Thermogemmatispora sp.]